jgi:hypothetical protein
MSRQRLRPSLEEATGYLCPRCHGTGMIRDLRSLALSIMRQIEQRALQERHGEIQAEVPTDIAAFLLNEKRETLVYLEQESGTRITILPHAILNPLSLISLITVMGSRHRAMSVLPKANNKNIKTVATILATGTPMTMKSAV